MLSPKELALDTPREKERARERKAALWIIVLTMALSAILAMALTVYFQKP